MIYRGMQWRMLRSPERQYLEVRAVCGGRDRHARFMCDTTFCEGAYCEEIVFLCSPVPIGSSVEEYLGNSTAAIIEARSKHATAFDGIPWAVHLIEDDAAWEHACAAFKAAQGVLEADQ